MKHRLGQTPGTPTFIVMRVADEEDKLPAKEHATYRSVVGTLSYLTKHSRPDLCNAVRELSKTMDRPAPIHLKEMYRIIRYVLETKRYGLEFYPKRCSWIIHAFSDSVFAGDRETRRSVYGYFTCFCGIPIAWKSKGMRSVVLSTTEAEYIALSEVVKEIKFIIQLMSTMNVNAEVPMTIYIDNVGAIWLSNNRTTSERIKHIHIRTAFVKEYKEEGKILIKFVKPEENDADINTKNTLNTTFKTHQAK